MQIEKEETIKIYGVEIPRKALNQGIEGCGIGLATLLRRGEYHCSLAAPPLIKKMIK
jgi:hypothetical protein